ncbi:hypothetical protein BXP70_26875 [Hymenobacter crusticola]|uniref:Uncharacterized protein n=1 Tax=Hymenobacter crusticola TaxID=1770526 RepID=A0A243W5Y3_9BACT|nr:hypothetical protein BXP70_26875 [Hymenobacter crusticola]
MRVKKCFASVSRTLLRLDQLRCRPKSCAALLKLYVFQRGKPSVADKTRKGENRLAPPGAGHEIRLLLGLRSRVAKRELISRLSVKGLLLPESECTAVP